MPGTTTRINDHVVCVEVPNVNTSAATTNAYILGRDPVVVVDPGSADGAGVLRDALASLGAPRVESIVLTHGHRDHAGGALALREATGAPVWLNPDELIEADARGYALPLDRPLLDGHVIVADGLLFDAVATPGHAIGHISLVERTSRVALAGDLVAGQGSIAIFPPYGDMAAYLNSLNRLLVHRVSRLLPGHGPILDDGPAVLRRYIARRLAREEKVLDLIGQGVNTAEELFRALYPGIPKRLERAATGTVLAHVSKLVTEGRIRRCEQDGVVSYEPV